MVVADVLDVADVIKGRYTGGMTASRNPEEISVADAMKLLGIPSRPTFYDVVEELRRTEGLKLKHRRQRWSKRAYYLRAEIEAISRGAYEEVRQMPTQHTGDFFD